MKYLLLAVLFAAVACTDKQKRERAEYFAAASAQQEGYYGSDAERAYEAEKTFIEFVKNRQRTGAFLANPDVLVWEYPRLALAAEACGRKEEADRLYLVAQRYARKVYPSEDPKKMSAEAMRAAIEEMTPVQQAPWRKK
jgi:hypothetical protein